MAKNNKTIIMLQYKIQFKVLRYRTFNKTFIMGITNVFNTGKLS